MTLQQLAKCREAFVTEIKRENSESRVHMDRWSLKQHWMGPEKGFADRSLNKRYDDFTLGYTACQRDSAQWLPITDVQRDGELWIVSDGHYSVPAWYCGMPGEDCWYEYGRGPAHGKEQYGLAPTLYKPFPEAPQ